MRLFAAILAATIALTLAFPSESVAQRRLPTDNELRAAYCARIVRHEADDLKHDLELVTRAISEAEERAKSGQTQSDNNSLNLDSLRSMRDQFQPILRERENTFNRLNSYVMPLAGHVEITGLQAAISRGNLDYEASRRALNSRGICLRDCIAGGSTAFEGCQSKCGPGTPPDLEAKFARCRKADWLPY